jgi:2-iminobutanoate/2-iminopropanoate deaminase
MNPTQKKLVVTAAGQPSIGISPAVRWGDLLFVSGQAAFDPETKSVIGDDVETQARVTLDKLDALLEAAGTSREHVLKMECYLRDGSDFMAWNGVFKEYYPEAPPSRSTVVAGQPLGDLLVEVAVIAGIPG